MKETIRTLASHFVVKSGITALGRRVGSYDGAIILYGHRVADDNEGYLQGLKPEWLEEQLAYLSRHFHIMSLGALLDCFEQSKPIPRRSVVLTFDDGFRDNYLNAFPLLKKYKIPATIFLVTGALDSGELPWSQRLGFYFQNTNEAFLTHTLTDGECMPLGSPAERRAAYLKVKKPIGQMEFSDRENRLSELSDVLRVEAPKDRMMTWDMAREMMEGGMEMGAHTMSHPLLANLSVEEAREEMVGSQVALKTHLGLERPTFCFPGGSRNLELIGVARELGFRSVFDSSPRLRVNSLANSDPFRLSRIGLPEAPRVNLEAELDGPFHRLRQGVVRI